MLDEVTVTVDPLPWQGEVAEVPKLLRFGSGLMETDALPCAPQQPLEERDRK